MCPPRRQQSLCDMFAAIFLQQFLRRICRLYPPTVFATHLPTFFLQQISLSNWKLGQCVPQEDSNLYATCLPLFSSNSFCDAFADFILHQFLRRICRLYPPTDLLIQLEYRTMCPPRRQRSLQSRCCMDLQGIQKDNTIKSNEKFRLCHLLSKQGFSQSASDPAAFLFIAKVVVTAVCLCHHCCRHFCRGGCCRRHPLLPPLSSPFCCCHC